MASTWRRVRGRLRGLLLGGAPGVTRRDVVAAYEVVLGRLPESEAAIKRFLSYPDRAAIGRDLLCEGELQKRLETLDGRFTVYELRTRLGPLELTVDELRTRLQTLAERLATPARPAPVFLGDRVLTHTHRGEWIYVAPDDVYMTPHLLKNGVWEQHVERVVERLLRPGQAAADLGANVGYYTLALASAVGPTGQVDAFEANPAAIRLLRDTLILNGLTQRVRLHAAAVMDRPGTVTLAASPHHLGSGNVFVGVPDPAYLSTYSVRTEVPAVTLDGTLSKVPELHMLRIDIEGSEPLALRGAVRLIERSRSLRIVTEWSPDMMAARADVREFVGWLEGLGFRFWRIAADSSLEPVEPAEMPTLPHCDLVLARGAMP